MEISETIWQSKTISSGSLTDATYKICLGIIFNIYVKKGLGIK